MLKNCKYWLRKFYRHSYRFQQYYQQIEQASRLGSDELTDYQNKQLQSLVEYCVEKVPYYQTLFKELGLKPHHLKTCEDLRHLPLMDKQTVRENFSALTAHSWEKPFYRSAPTSGSSGTPSSFLRDFNSINFENASVWHYWHRMGDHKARRITLRGELFCSTDQQEPPFWKYNPADQELLMSIYHLSSRNFPAYLDKILEFQPEVLYCYPSAGYLLAKLFKEAGVSYRFKLIFTSSEALEDSTRSLIENVFQCRIRDWYGQAERVSAIAQCQEGNYHIEEPYSWTELLEGPNGHEIIGTPFFNKAMPLLRYRTFDTVIPMQEPCRCGSVYRGIKKIIGRPAAYLLTPDHRRIPNVQSLFLRNIDNIIEAQVYQERSSGFEIRVVTSDRFSDTDRQKLLAQARQYTSTAMDISIVEVDEIPRGPNGKFQSLINIAEESSILKKPIQRAAV